MGRIDEVRRLATLAVNDPALKPEALREISQRASEAGAIAEGVALRARVAEISTPTASDLNNQAWARLFIDDAKGLGSARAEAQRAVEQAPRARSSQLNTLAAVLAETGEPEQAMVTLRKGVAVAGGLDNADWVVIGRVAEAYGMPAEARRAYQRVEKPSRPSATSAWALAQRWLARLEAGDAKAPAAAGAVLPR
jgi:tetratricopeptide (TPR) repeat protein